MYSIHTESIEHHCHTITIKWYHDEDSGPPWEACDGHGPVSEWTTRDKRPGERLLCSDRNSKRYYDFAGAIKLAKKDGWDAPPYKTGTKGEQALRAVESDYEHLRRWCNDDWHYVGYQIEIEGQIYEDSLWGIESDGMDDVTKDAFAEAIAWLDRELLESERAACSDIMTEA